MNRIIFCIITMFLFCGCAQVKNAIDGKPLWDKRAEAKFIITQNEEGSASIDANYESFEKLVQRIDEKEKNEMLSPEVTAEMKNIVPKGGRFIFTIYRSTINAADTKYFLYIVQKNGKEISRKNGMSKIANRPASTGAIGRAGKWWNLALVDIEESIEQKDKIEVFVVDQLSNSRDSFLLERNPEAKEINETEEIKK